LREEKKKRQREREGEREEAEERVITEKMAICVRTSPTIIALAWSLRARQMDFCRPVKNSENYL